MPYTIPRLKVQEEDGAPATYPVILKFPNGTLTDNGDGSISLATGAGGLSNVVEDTTPQLGGDLDLNGFNLDFPTTPNISDVIDDDTMATASAIKLATSESIKAYVDAQIATVNTLAEILAIGNLTGGTDILHYDAVNDGNPEFRIGSSDLEELHVQSVFDLGAATLNYVLFTTDVASVAADKGLYRFNVDGADILDIDDGGINLAASMGISIAGTDIITDAIGTATLSNIDALDATTEGTIEAAIDTLANLVSIQSLTVTLADAGANAIFGWDDVAGAYENLTQAEVLAIIGDSSDTAKGVVELATTAETETGTDATRAVTPDGLHDMTTLLGAAWFLDEDTMVSDSAVKVASQQSIKAYVDAQVAGADTLAEVLANGNTTGGTDILHYDAVNDGNPEFRIGSSDLEELHVQSVFDLGAATLNYVLFTTDVASVAADKGLYRFNVDGADILDIDDGGINLAASMGISIAGTDIITDAIGTATLSNIDALDATTEGTIEAAIDTLANLVSIQSLTVTLADAGANAIFGWDDVAGAYENLTQAEVLAIIGDSSDTAKGVVELATTAETETGTDATRAVTPDGLHDMTTLLGAAWFLDEDTMVSDSAVKVASQQSIKAYVDTEVAGVGGGNKTIFLPAQYTKAAQESFVFEQPSVNLADGVTERAAANWTLPDNFTSITSVEAYWTTGSATGPAVFEFKSRAVASGENLGAGGSADSIASTTYANGGTNLLNIINVTAMSDGLTLTAGDLVSFMCIRSGGDASDDISGVVSFLGFRIVYS